ncbi:MAG: tetratricopeptide repeat protein [Proteobacteria bacterium]|nr:tetratricopeptide repeat protein [Pseudomonadota bacterium]
MREFGTKYLKLFQQTGLLMLILVFIPGTAMAKIKIEKMVIRSNPLVLELFVGQKVPVKVIKIEEKELLVALKNAMLSKNFKIFGADNPAIRDISVEALEGDVVAVMVTGKIPFGDIRSGYNTAGSSFSINLGKTVKAVPSPPPVPVKTVSRVPGPQLSEKPLEKKTIEKRPGVSPKPQTQAAPGLQKQAAVVPVEKKSVKESTPPLYSPPKREKTEFKGDISDLYRVIDKFGCKSEEIEKAIAMVGKKMDKAAFEVLENHLSKEASSCREQAYYLRAYTYYKSIVEKDYTHLIKAERMFQDALVSFPKSDYVPFAYAAIGMIHTALKNTSAAEGYFNIVKQGYAQYSGMPEVEYHLAGVYAEKGYTDKALQFYKQVFESSLENNYIPDAGVGYGKALYQKKRYFDALSVFNYVVESNVKKIYEAPELLQLMSNANFELGLNRPARQTFMRLLNLFPGIPERDVILSKVGDTYGMENNPEKATRIYELVREKFPDSQGYINASIGIARYLKTDQEKIEIYEMIKQKFPENTYARIAMMRLAEIYQKNKEYNKCIKEIEDLLSTHPRGLQYEAIKLMQKAYEALFEKQLKADEYTSVLSRYESEHIKLDKMGSREIAFSVGIAYSKAGLYEQSFNHLISAYKQYKRSLRSPELLFGLGVAMDESGRDDDAVKLLAAFSKQFPKDRHRVEALIRMGQIYMEKDQFDRSAETLETAYAISGKYLEKGRILILKSDIYEKKKDLKTASKLREQAIKDFAAAPGKNYTVMTAAYKTLGNAYLGLKSYVQAADAFSRALGFSEGDRAKANLGFLLGDAYQKGNIINKAKQAFEQVAGNNDSVWARLARQRLSTLELAETAINS